MKKKIIFILLALIMLGTISYFYVNNIFLPVRVKQQAEETLSKHFDRPVTIEQLRFSIFTGFQINNILIKEDINSKKAFLRIDQISFNVLLAPFIKEKAVILPSLRIKKPYIHLVRASDGQWNFSSLWSPKDSDTPSAYTPYIRKIILEDGSVDYEDHTKENTFTETLRSVDLKTTVNIDKTFDFSLSTQIPIENTNLAVKGKFTLKDKSVQAEVKTENLNLMKYFPAFNPNKNIQLHDGLLYTSTFDLTYQSGKLTLEGAMQSNNLDVQLGTSKRVKGNIRLNGFSFASENGTLKASGELLIPSAELILDAKKQIYGDIRAELKNVFLHGKEASLEGDIWVDQMRLDIKDTAQFKGSIKALKTNFSYAPNNIQTQTQMTVEDGSLVYNKVHQGTLTSFSRDLKLSWKDNQLQISGDIELKNPTYHFPQGSWKSEQLTTDQFQLETKNGTLRLTSLFNSKASSVNLTNGFDFIDNPKIDLSYTFDPETKDQHQILGSFLFQNGHLKNLPQIKEALALKGRVVFKNDSFKSDNLHFETLDTSWQLAGNLTLGKTPTANATITTQKLFLEKLNPVLGEHLKKFDLNLSGPTALELHYLGEIKKEAQPKIRLTADLKDVSVFHPKIQTPFSHLNGRFYYEDDLIQWTNLKGVWLDEKVTVDGSVKNFARPVLQSIIDSPKLHIETQANILTTFLQVTLLKGNLFSSEFDLSGDVFFKEDGTHVFLKGESFVDTKDLPRILPQYKKTWDNLQLDGVLKSFITFRGHPKHWRDWSLSVDASAPVLQVKGHTFENFQFNYGQRDRTISDANVKANLYGGKFFLTTNSDLAPDDISLKGTVELFDLNLERYMLESGSRKKLKGNINLNANIEGPILKLELLEGSGSLSITDGSLYHLNVIEGLSSIALIPEFKNTTFTEGRADFIIKDKKFQSHNTIMKSPTINLVGKGWIDFDGRINFDVVPEFSEIALMKSESFRKGPTALLTHTVDIKITGTVKKPKYDVNSAPLSIIKEAPAIIREGVGAILGEIF